MRRKIIVFAALATALAVQAKDIRKVTVTTEPQMHCANCEKKIKNFFKFEKGIKKIETDIPQQHVTITYDADKTTEQTIIDSFSKIEYQVRKVEDEKNDKRLEISD